MNYSVTNSKLHTLIQNTFDDWSEGQSELFGFLRAELIVSIRGEYVVDLFTTKNDTPCVDFYGFEEKEPWLVCEHFGQICFDRKADATKFIKLVNNEFMGAYRKGFYVEYQKDVEGENKWVIQNEDDYLHNLLLDETDQLWNTKDEAIEVIENFLKSEVYKKHLKSEEAYSLFNELDDDGLVDTNHYDTALCQKQNVQYHWDEDVSVSEIETVIEYFKNLKQLIALERKVNKLAIYG